MVTILKKLSITERDAKSVILRPKLIEWRINQGVTCEKTACKSIHGKLAKNRFARKWVPITGCEIEGTLQRSW